MRAKKEKDKKARPVSKGSVRDVDIKYFIQWQSNRRMKKLTTTEAL